jgi:hypothetical protein
MFTWKEVAALGVEVVICLGMVVLALIASGHATW